MADLKFGDRTYRKMGDTWMVQPATLMRGFIAVSEESTSVMLDEIERLRAMTAEQAHVHDAWLAERSLADQLAVALAAQGSASFDEGTNLAIKRLALDAFEEARRG